MVAYLNRAGVRDRPLRPEARALLSRMIRRSDNNAATRIRNIVGDAALVRLAQGDVATAAASIRDALEHPMRVPFKERPPAPDLQRATVRARLCAGCAKRRLETRGPALGVQSTLA